MGIPRIIHQLWKDAEIPVRYLSLRETWMRLNPGFEMRLWTDADLTALVREHYPQLLAIFEGYRSNICRADLGRYLVLHRHGGVYADLDCECLKPIEPLIDGARLVIGHEPLAHKDELIIAASGFQSVLCPSFIAAEPAHPFWDAVLARAPQAAAHEDAIEATGPLLLTRTYEAFADKASIRIAPEEQLYPISKHDCWNGRVHELEFWERRTRQAYVLHYWDGSWFRPSVWVGGLQGDVQATIGNPAVPRAGFDHSRRPRISCLMVSRGLLAEAKPAIDAFLAQTYGERELIIAAVAPETALTDQVRALGRRGVRMAIAPPGSGVTALRNLAAGLAEGEILCRWDESDLHDPRRLDVQYEVLKHLDAHACLMRRWTSWRPDERRLGVVEAAPLGGSLLWLKAAAPSYPKETDVVGDALATALMAQGRVALFDLSRLIISVDPPAGADEAMATAFTGDRYEAVLGELSKRLPTGAVTAAREPPSPRPPIEVRLAAPFGAFTGLAAAARGTAAALATTDLAVIPVPMPWARGDERLVPRLPRPRKRGSAWPAWLVHTNPGMLVGDMHTGVSPFTQSDRETAFTVGLWAWETVNGLHQTWIDAAHLFDEIWAPSRHAADGIARDIPLPVVAMPHAVAPSAPVKGRAALGLPEEPFLFLFAFDALSNIRRKNPAGVIAAYRAAFPRASAEAALVIKTKWIEQADLDALTALAGGRPDIHILDGAWSVEDLQSLIAACDAYISLHRAEGFGLSMAEAMAYAKPVIATAYSGNMDYMSDETAYLVPYRLTRLQKADGDYRAGVIWAEPDLGAAAAMMRRVFDQRGEAAAVGRRAAAWVAANLSPQAVGKRMADRLALRAGAAPATGRPAPKRTAAQAPKLLVLTPIKDAAEHLPRYAELLERLDYDPARLSLAFLEGDSRDGTPKALDKVVGRLGERLARVQAHRFDYGFRIHGERWTPAIQRRRREIIARSRNRLLALALTDEDYVLWLDADLADYPPDLARRLLEAGKDIVVPHCVDQTGQTFDLNTFRFAAGSGGRDHPLYLLDGLFQPPRGVGREYLDAFQHLEMTPVDSVGGTALLIRADLHREGLNFPPFSYRGYIETEGLAMMAADMGVRSWGLPRLTITHS